MIVTSWNNGKLSDSGAGYGLKIDENDRDQYFKKEWDNVELQLINYPHIVEVNINKQSFWSGNCRELINKDIGIWLIENGLAPWKKGQPPKLTMEPISKNRFLVKPI
ncbi:hypothetical protein [Methanohalophilus halophilus]|uniref:Uncharacterized protein n=1 Tax=Methanohalophilus halophilus TaxID=2177 RepID=A0A1L3Q3R8_9EURY|nr:hypothetical protein [Methanohalophilus halophilus]APH39490.1 hypothetical protein BHR79_08360 [Methanohalophilus halophilus]RNI09176.1 hypothetical protein EFE40_06915 [Methanohalophilus halophilus]SDW27918.1 hypothetical protein SAMN04515625_0580 [Methanohalophilus halophilus]